MEFNVYTVAAFVLYAVVIIVIGIISFKRSKNMSDYFLGGRNLGSWTTAISAQASDMSGWLLMGLPGAIYAGGLTESWVAIGLFVGTYLNWRICASRLRRMSYAAGDAITIPEYFQKRFFSTSPVLRFVCAAIIFFFFLIYTASAFSSGAKLFEYVFGINYTLALAIGALIIISYTFLGGFLAVCYTDVIQGMLMFAALIVVPVVILCTTKDMGAVYETAVANNSVPNNFLSFIHNTDGSLAITTVVSGLAWGLGYFGMPHILVRFMAIKSSDLIKKSRIIATIWVFVTLVAAALVGIFGKLFLIAPENAELLEKFNAIGDNEKIFMFLSSSLLPALIAGIILSAILAAIMSTADSQLLVTSSAVTNDIYKVFLVYLDKFKAYINAQMLQDKVESTFKTRILRICKVIFRTDHKTNVSDKILMWISRGAVILVAVIAFFIAFDEHSSVMGLVSYAWAGFGAAFGPAMLLSLFWKKMTMPGAVAGIIAGGASVILWESIPVLSGTGVYSLLPAFFIALVAVVVVSLMTKVDEKKVDELFAKAKETKLD